jgi:hypothetical protein
VTDDPREDELMELLEALGQEERQDLDAARADATPPGRAEAELARALGVKLEQRAARRPWRLLALAAAVVLAAVLVNETWFTHQGTPDDVPLGVRLSDLSPRGTVADLGRFRFSADLGGEVWARVTVYDADAPDDAPALATSPPLRAPTWDADPAEAATWTRIRWTLEVFSGSASPLSLVRVETEAER